MSRGPQDPGRHRGALDETGAVATIIAGGHAYGKHAAEFASIGVGTKEEYAKLIDHIMRISTIDNVRSLVRGRTAYWDPKTGTVVIHDREAADKGTAFRPRDGRAYFDALK